MFLLMNSAADGRPTNVCMLPTILPEKVKNDSSTKPQEVLADFSSVLPVCQCQHQTWTNCQACVCQLWFVGDGCMKLQVMDSKKENPYMKTSNINRLEKIS